MAGHVLVAPPGMLQETGQKDQKVLSCLRPKTALKLQLKKHGLTDSGQKIDKRCANIQPEIRIYHRVIIKRGEKKQANKNFLFPSRIH